jgi:ankyrin repeat protein
LQLLQVGANVHHANLKPDGGSALHEAVAHKHEAVVELLLRNGASPFVENCKVGRALQQLRMEWAQPW